MCRGRVNIINTCTICHRAHNIVQNVSYTNVLKCLQFCAVALLSCYYHISVLRLNQAKKLVESLPQEIRANVSKEEAEKLKAALEAAGGTVVLE